MPTTDLTMLASGSVGDIWTASTSTKAYCLNTDDGDTAFIYRNCLNGGQQSMTVTGYSAIPADAIIASVTHVFKARRVQATSVSIRGNLYLGGNYTYGTTRTQAQTYTQWSEALARPGGGSWVQSDFSTLEWCVYIWNEGVDVDNYCTYGKVSVLWDYPGGGILEWLSWLPPLIAVASHGLSRMEIVKILHHMRTRPSCDEDFAALLAAFQRRPRFAFHGIGDSQWPN